MTERGPYDLGFPGLAQKRRQDSLAALWRDQVGHWSDVSPLLLAGFLAAGIVGFHALPQDPPERLGLLAVIIGCVVALTLFRRSRVLRWFGLSVAAICFGYGLSSWEVSRLGNHLLQDNSSAVSITARVKEVRWRADGPRFVLDQIQDSPLRSVQVKWRGGAVDEAQALALLGKRVQWNLSLLEVGGPVVPGGFDFRRQAYFRGLSAYGFSRGPPEVLSADRVSPVQKWRLALRDKFRKHMNENAAALATALTVGLRGDLDEATDANIRDAGLAHLLAISGLHVGMVVGALFFALRFVFATIPKLGLRLSVHRLAAGLALLGAAGYFLLSGGSVPTQRATLVALLSLIAMMISRRPFSLRSVGIAAILVLVLKPSTLTTASFQMSFAAVTGLIVAFRVLEQRRTFQVRNRIFGYGIGVLASSVIATLMTSAFALYHFQQVSLLGILSNMIAVPLTAMWIMPLLLLSVVLAPLGLEGAPLFLAEFGLDALVWLAKITALIRDGIITTHAWPPLALVLIGTSLWLAAILIRWLQLLALWPLVLAVSVIASADLPSGVAHRERGVLVVGAPPPVLQFGTREPGLVVMAGGRFEIDQLERFFNQSARLCESRACPLSDVLVASQSAQILGALCALENPPQLLTLRATPRSACTRNQALDLRDFPPDAPVVLWKNENGTLSIRQADFGLSQRIWTKAGNP